MSNSDNTRFETTPTKADAFQARQVTIPVLMVTADAADTLLAENGAQVCLKGDTVNVAGATCNPNTIGAGLLAASIIGDLGSRHPSITDVSAVLCYPVHVEQELSNAEQVRGNVAAVKRGVMKKKNVTVAGVEGRSAHAFNGLYEDTGDLYNGKPLFRKRNDPGGACEWLRFSTTDKWYFSDTQSKDANNTACCCHSLEAGKDHPTHVNKWNIYANGANESWETHAPMKCSSSHSTTFVEKAQRAEKAGARALVVINR